MKARSSTQTEVDIELTTEEISRLEKEVLNSITPELNNRIKIVNSGEYNK